MRALDKWDQCEQSAVLMLPSRQQTVGPSESCFEGMSVRGRIIGADAIRSFACLAVLFVHLGAFSSTISWPQPIAAFIRLTEYGKFGVCIFFVLSGYLLGLPFWHSLDQRGRLPSLRVYFLRRAARIVPATWVCLIASFLLAQWFLSRIPAGHEIVRLLAGMTFVSDWSWVTLFPTNVNGPLWSLSFEVSSYVLMVVGFMALKGSIGPFWTPARGRAAWLLIIALALGAHAVTTVLLAHDASMSGFQFGVLGGARSWFPQYNAFGFFAMFAIGTFAAGLSSLDRSQRSNWAPVFQLAWLVAAYGIVAALVAGMQVLSFVRPPFAFPALPFVVASLLLIAPHLPARALFENKVVTFVADISFGIYIWHDLLLPVFASVLPVGIEPHERACFVAAITVVSTVVLAYVSFRFFERPIMSSARKFEGSPIVKLDTRRLDVGASESGQEPSALPNTSTPYSVW